MPGLSPSNNRGLLVKSWLLQCRSFLIALTLVSLPVLSQDSSEYDQWKQQFLTEFDTYKDEIDREFAEFLKLDWKKFATRTGVKRDPVPKPVSMPRDVPQDVAAPKPISPAAIPVEQIDERPPSLPEPVASEGERIRFSFLGHKITLFVSIDRNFVIAGAITQQSLQKGFDALAKSDYENLTTDLIRIRDKLHLNDWAYMQLLRSFSREFLPASINSANLLSWFLLLKSGIKSRIAFANNELYLLVSTRQPLYDITFFKFNNEKFYVISGHTSIARTLYTYNGTYPKKLPKSNFSGINQIIIGKDIGYREISFQYGANHYKLRIPFNRHVIDFLATYPQMHVDQYFNVAISRQQTPEFVMRRVLVRHRFPSGRPTTMRTRRRYFSRIGIVLEERRRTTKLATACLTAGSFGVPTDKLELEGAGGKLQTG